MKKVRLVIKFKSQCLGHIPKTNEYFMFPRDAEGKVMIMQSWWRASLRKATEQLEQPPSPELKQLSQRILLETKCVECSTVMTKEMPQGKQVTYDCFPIGAILDLNFLVPLGISDAAIRQAFERVGSWIGLSPRHAGEGYGRYEILKFEIGGSGDDKQKEEK